MEYQNKVKICLATLKEHVKSKGISYQQLADRLKVSLLTVKRQLNADEISMSKLLALCDAAAINFSDIWQQVEQHKVEHTVFTQAQDAAFYYNPHLFHYFIELFSARLTPKQIESKWEITAASSHIYLRKLEQLELIKLSVHNKVSFLISEPVGFSGESMNIMKPVQAALQDVSEKLIAPREDEPFVIVKPMVLSEELRYKMYQEVKELVSRYAELSERYFIHSDLPPKQLVICDYTIPEAPPLPDITNVTGFKHG